MKVISHKFIQEIKKQKEFSFLFFLFSEFPESHVYLVGGIVRDLLLGKESTDFDLVVTNIDSDSLETFLKQHGHTHLVGKKFGVFKFTPWDSHTIIDIALPRKDFSLFTGKYTDFIIQTDPHLSIQDDLSRRDFTINAMAIDLKDGIVIDPFKGASDLEKKIIKTVGDASSRFQEDYTRVLRALRFSCQLDFTIEKKTFLGILKYMPHINDEIDGQRIVPYESIAKEITKAFTLNPVRAFDLCDESSAFEYLMPELLKMKNCPQPPEYHSEGDVFVHTRMALKTLTDDSFEKEFSKKPNSLTVFAVLFHDIGKPYTIKTPEKDKTDRIRFDEHDIKGAKIAREICERLKLSSVAHFGIDSDDIFWLVKHHLILIAGKIEDMKNTTIEKYFYSKTHPSESLKQLIFCDISASIPKAGKPDYSLYTKLKERLHELSSLNKNKNILPEPLLSGQEIMDHFKLNPGKQIGELKNELREAQLNTDVKTKEDAFSFLKKKLK